MYKLTVKRFFAFCFSVFAWSFLFLLSIIPVKLYSLGLLEFFGEVFPAIEIILVYYLSSCKNAGYLILFCFGVVIDQIYQLPIGTNSLAFIIGKIILNYINSWIILKKEINNILVFAGYSLFIISFRYLTLAVNYEHHSTSMAVCFYYLVTVTTYPIFKQCIKKILF